MSSEQEFQVISVYCFPCFSYCWCLSCGNTPDREVSSSAQNTFIWTPLLLFPFSFSIQTEILKKRFCRSVNAAVVRSVRVIFVVFSATFSNSSAGAPASRHCLLYRANEALWAFATTHSANNRWRLKATDLCRNLDQGAWTWRSGTVKKWDKWHFGWSLSFRCVRGSK